MQVRFQAVEKRYGDFCAVKDLNLTIKSGALHFLLGPSGCGKTTSLRMLAGLENPTSGSIFLGDKDVTKQSAADRGIGMVFQNYALWPHMTVKKNIEYGLKLKKLSSSEIKKRLDEVLAITQLGRFVDRLPGQLSGGQQQRVALARALAVRPHVLLLDEPLSNLDAKLRLEMRENICRIHQETKITTVYVTHDQKEALSMGTDISIMYGGSLMQTGSPRGLYDRPESLFVAGFIGETNLIDGKVVKSLNDGMVEVESPLGLLSARSHQKEWAQGALCKLSIRPEALWLVENGKKADVNGFRARLDGLTYLGDSEQLRLDKDGTSLKANIFHGHDHSSFMGKDLELSVFPKDVLVLSCTEQLGQGT